MQSCSVRALGVSLVLALASCSFVTVRGNTQRGHECTTSYAAPVVDLSVVATFVVVALATAHEDRVAALTSPGALIGALAAGSMTYGALVVHGCNNHHEKLERDVQNMIASLVPVAEAGACDEVRKAVLVAEVASRDLDVKYALTNPAVLRCLVVESAP